jgi:hypothetical protein
MSKSNTTHFSALAADELLCNSKHFLLVSIGTCSILFAPFSPASAFQLTTARGPDGELPLINTNLFETQKFGIRLPTVNKDGFSLDIEKFTSDYAMRYGCPPANTCDYHFQYKVQDIVWPKATFTNFINIVPSGEYFYYNAKKPPDRILERAAYDSSYILEHEKVHLNQDYSFLTKHFQPLVDWAAGYIGDWFNSTAAAMQALKNDFDANYNAALNDATPKFFALFNASTHDTNGRVTDLDTDGKLMLYPPQDPADPWTYKLRDVDVVWRTNMDDLIASYTPAYDLKTTPGEEPIPCPGPLPVLGVGYFFAYSRRLRARIKSHNRIKE